MSRSEAAALGRAKAAVARRAATEHRRAAIATRTAPTGYRIGQWVRTNTPRCRPFHDRVGVVVTNNLGEVGVGFGADWSIQLPGVDAWFVPSELGRIRWRNGWSREKADAFLAISRSAFARRGWIEGEPDSPDQLQGHVDAFIGGVEAHCSCDCGCEETAAHEDGTCSICWQDGEA